MKWWLVILAFPNDSPSEGVLMAQAYPSQKACMAELRKNGKADAKRKIKVVTACVKDSNVKML